MANNENETLGVYIWERYKEMRDGTEMRDCDIYKAIADDVRRNYPDKENYKDSNVRVQISRMRKGTTYDRPKAEESVVEPQREEEPQHAEEPQHSETEESEAKATTYKYMINETMDFSF